MKDSMTASQIPSNEATKEQLQLATNQGKALEKALNEMIGNVADDGQEIKHGPYFIGYAIEKAEGMYKMDEDSKLVWHEPGEDNVHVEVSVRDAADGRFVPGLTIHARLIDSEGNDVGMHRQPYIWHPWLYHYGRNWHVAKSGDYDLEVRIQAPDFPRHDKKNGKRYGEDVTVMFSPVKIAVK
jgi:hypothetical protein